MTRFLSVIFLLTLVQFIDAQKLQDWEDPNVFAINTLAPHAIFYVFDKPEDARAIFSTHNLSAHTSTATYGQKRVD